MGQLPTVPQVNEVSGLSDCKHLWGLFALHLRQTVHHALPSGVCSVESVPMVCFYPEGQSLLPNWVTLALLYM